ncbi:helix-turn-helix domain-containing protein [Rhodococcus erythropolis]|uniref:helix-turn-helix domain-containing protein n=1 Tax=Rhodococcus erythropolis TaxID=1833 RepID=UPI00210DC3F5|nr:helix-turn-helix domain-containing protein [Rhodococcus erythropolis]MCQ4125285.1 helix-turn-helix domain-containing protein [Rhodococcus erythropolis]
MGPRLVFPAGEVPEIPAARLASTANEREPLLFWVHTGRAELQISGRTRSVTAGAAIWVPAGVAYSIRVDPGAVAFPIPLPAADLPPALNRVIDFEIPADWQDWLVHQFAHNLGFLRGETAAGAGLIELVAGVHSDGDDNSPSYSPPRLPRSAETLEIARTLLRTPSDDTELSRFAQQLKIGVRTLQRRFIEETGLSFVRWRTSARIAAATSYLAAGREIGWTGSQVGFATPAGFTRAFREHTGMTPTDYARANRRPTPPREDETLAQGVALLSEEGARSGSAPAPPTIPASGTWARVNDFHVVVWIYRGSARVTFGDRTWNLRRGDAMWLPAGVRNSVEIAEGSLLLPLGSQPGASPVTAPPPRVLHFAREAQAYLLHTVVANYTHLRPEIHDPARIARLIRSAAAVPLPSGDQADPVETILAALRKNPADSRTLPDWSARLGVDEDMLLKDFVAATGQSFPRWRGQLRMTLARAYLEEGLAAGETARRLGYAHASGFTKVFIAAHGMSPRDYQRRGWRGTVEGLIDS